MKTAEEKAKEYARKECPIISSGAMQTLTIDEWRELAKRDYLAGYNEAMRWRDVNEELPPNPNTVFIKYETPQHLVRYGVGRYLDIRGKNPWLTYDCVNREVTHWRPIEYYKNNG